MIADSYSPGLPGAVGIGKLLSTFHGVFTMRLVFPPSPRAADRGVADYRKIDGVNRREARFACFRGDWVRGSESGVRCGHQSGSASRSPTSYCRRRESWE